MGDGQLEKSVAHVRSRRRTVIGAVAVGAVVVAGGVAAAILLPGGPSAQELATVTPSATAPQASRSASPSPTPTPVTVTSCDPTTQATSARREHAFPADGPRSRPLIEFASEPVDAPTTRTVPVDEDLVLLLTASADADGARTHLSLLDTAQSTVRWETSVDRDAWLVGSPLTSGVDDRILIRVPGRLIALAVSDGTVLVERAEEQWLSPVGVGFGGVWSPQTDVAQSPGAYFVQDQVALHRLDPQTLRVEWSIDGDEIGAQRYEGNSFIAEHIDDTVLLSGHPFDAVTGEPRGWSRESTHAVGAGVVLEFRYLFDDPSSFDLSAVDLMTGEKCWSAEVFDFAADDDDLWVVTADGRLVALDPSTGEELEDRGEIPRAELDGDAEAIDVRLIGDRLLTSSSGWSVDGSAVASWTTDGPVVLPQLSGVDGLLETTGQLVEYGFAGGEGRAELTGYATDGSIAWSRPVDMSGPDDPVVVETTRDAATIRVELLH